MVPKVLARAPPGRRRKAEIRTFKVKTKWANQDSIFSARGWGGGCGEVGGGCAGNRENKLLEIIREQKKALGITTDDFHLRGRNQEIRL